MMSLIVIIINYSCTVKELVWTETKRRQRFSSNSSRICGRVHRNGRWMSSFSRELDLVISRRQTATISVCWRTRWLVSCQE